MKRLLSLVLSLSFLATPISLYAGPAPQDAEVVESKLRIKDIKKLVGTQISKKNTCLDEYLARRKQLSLNLWLTPALGPIEVYGGTFGGIFAGGLLSTVFKSGEWTLLIAGGLVGFAAGTALFLGGATKNIINFSNNDAMIKWIAEARLSNPDKVSDRLFKQYSKKFKNDHATQEEIQSLIIKWDESGELCNGRIVAPKRSKKGKKIKQRLANKSEIFKELHRVISK